MAERVNVAVDAMGGDNAPGEIVKGAVEAINADKRVKVFLVGRKVCDKKKSCRIILMMLRNWKSYRAQRRSLRRRSLRLWRFERKKDSSIVKSMHMVKEGLCDALVSAGSTGAVLVGGR